MSQQGNAAGLSLIQAGELNLPPAGKVVLPPNADPAQVDNFIRANYGNMSWMLAIPELKAIAEKVIGPNGITVSQDVLNGMVSNTNWWKGSTAAMRSYAQLQGEDPASARAQLTKTVGDLTDQAQQSGIRLTRVQIGQMAQQSIAYGWDSSATKEALYAEGMRQAFAGTSLAGIGTVEPNGVGNLTGSGADDTRAGGILNGPARIIRGNPFGGGVMGNAYDTIMAQAHDYMVTVSPTTASQWAVGLATGVLSQDAIKGNLISYAVGKFPTLKSQIEGGITPAQMFDPIKQAIAKSWEMSPDAINWNDPKYGQVFQYSPPKGAPDTGTVRPMTETEATNWAHMQPQFDNTDQFKQSAATLTKGLSQTMGVTNFS